MSALPAGQPDRILLRLSDIEQWQAERDRLAAEHAEIGQRILHLDEKLRAVSVLYTDDAVLTEIEHADPVTDETATGEHETLPQAAERIVRMAEHHLSNQEIREALQRSFRYNTQLEQNPNYFYTMMARLVKRGRVVKKGGKYGPPADNLSAKGGSYAG